MVSERRTPVRQEQEVHQMGLSRIPHAPAGKATILAALAAAALALALAPPASADAKHFFLPQGQAPAATPADTVSNDLIYHGGNAGPGAIGIQKTPAVYLIYWGPEWAT